MLEHDHDAILDDLSGIILRFRTEGYAAAQRLIARGTRDAVLELRRRLGAHLELEERVLFPTLDHLVVGAASATASLIGEHQLLLSLADRLEEGPSRERAGALMAALLVHVDREDRALEPILRRLSAPEAHALRRRAMQWRIEHWVEEAGELLAVGGVEVTVRGLDDGALSLVVRSPLSEPESIMALEQKIGALVTSHEPAVKDVRIHHETRGVRHAQTAP